MLRIGIITISDRSSKGERPDLSGPELEDLLKSQGWEVAGMEIIPDELQVIKDTLITGGTGFSPRDITPEATLQIIERETPGLTEAMRAESLKVTPHAMMSRAQAGIRGQTLIVNLPGSPRAAVENLTVILPVVEHAVDLLSGDPGAEAGHRFNGN